MSTAVLTSTLTGDVSVPSKFSLLMKRFVNALAESRARSAARELHRHQAFLDDLARRQDHSSAFLTQDNALPAKI